MSYAGGSGVELRCRLDERVVKMEKQTADEPPATPQVEYDFPHPCR